MSVCVCEIERASLPYRECNAQTNHAKDTRSTRVSILQSIPEAVRAPRSLSPPSRNCWHEHKHTHVHIRIHTHIHTHTHVYTHARPLRIYSLNQPPCSRIRTHSLALTLNSHARHRHVGHFLQRFSALSAAFVCAPRRGPSSRCRPTRGQRSETHSPTLEAPDKKWRRHQSRDISCASAERRRSSIASCWPGSPAPLSPNRAKKKRIPAPSRCLCCAEGCDRPAKCD